MLHGQASYIRRFVWPVSRRHVGKNVTPHGREPAHLLVAAMKTTPMSGVKPSISVSSWFSVCSRSSFVFMPALTGAATRRQPRISITSAAP